MSCEYDKTRQFKFTPWEFLAKLDLLNWFRYAAIVKKLTEIKPKAVLEVGPGEGVIKNVMKGFVERYETLDVNPKLSPTHQGDVRKFKDELCEKYDCVIAADILEHIPFEDLEIALKNLNSYLV
ncbi:MAG TPA: methyltransferase domain-containing protein, partial [Candidatus Paceibacterota bacterium]|nr:methyltransferase domain-containing protein [Candidatus Paceibacterota bacterium]